MNRRRFLGGACVAVAGAAGGALLPRGTSSQASEGPAAPEDAGWRALFDLDPALVHLGGLFLASHPRPVREAIERHRAGLDDDPVGYLFAHDTPGRMRVVRAAGDYFGADHRGVALTGSTTQGLALLYHGLSLEAGDELLCTEHDHYATWYSLQLKAEASGASMRRVALYDGLAAETTDEALVERAVEAVRPSTRVLAITWVHSDSGLKLPVAAIDAELRRRGLRDQLLLCVDGVHGFGVEDATIGDLGCDFFVAGCHKWMLGPRGTGVIIAREPALFEQVAPIVPPFGAKHTPGLYRTPGGFHDFEHRWAMAEAFELHQAIGKDRVQAHIHGLARQLKEGLAGIPGATVQTPLEEERSAGIVAFDLRGHDAQALVRQLRDEHGFVLTRSPYGTRSVRATPGLYNTPEEIDRLLEVLRGLG